MHIGGQAVRQTEHVQGSDHPTLKRKHDGKRIAHTPYAAHPGSVAPCLLKQVLPLTHSTRQEQHGKKGYVLHWPVCSD
jgi:hypothetical protein